MKNAILLMLLTMTTTSLWAQANQNLPGTPGYTGNSNNNNRQQNSRGAGCEQLLETTKNVKAASAKEFAPTTIDKAGDCEQLAAIAKVRGQKLATATSRPTADGKIVCYQPGGFTADYDSCKKVSLLYDAVLIAEQGMIAAQKLTVDSSNAKATATVTKEIAAGNGQNAAIDATIARNELNAKLFKTQAISYSSAVAAITGSVALWKTKKGFVKECGNVKGPKFEKIQGEMLEQYKVIFKESDCEGLLDSVKESEDVFANNTAKGQFLAAVGAFAIKAADAYKKAGMNEFVGEKLKKDDLKDDDTTASLDPCMNSTAAECANNGGQGSFSTGAFQGSNVEFGSGSSNGINFGDGTGVGDIAADAPNGPTDSVADAASPFEAQAKAANGILNPANEATTAAGGGNSPGGGGGAGGGGGGGSASLGDDLAGATADANKDPDIATNKLSGKYKGGKAGGFQAVAKSGSKEEANPFASLFDSKSDGGGIEEDRSIASDSGEGSGLFQKISKKYGQIQQEKRIEGQNLE
jgi:hypothetical protein